MTNRILTGWKNDKNWMRKAYVARRFQSSTVHVANLITRTTPSFLVDWRKRERKKEREKIKGQNLCIRRHRGWRMARDRMVHNFLGKTTAGNGVDLEKERKREREREHRRPFDRMCHLVPGSRTSSYWQANQPTRRPPPCLSRLRALRSRISILEQSRSSREQPFTRTKHTLQDR